MRASLSGAAVTVLFVLLPAASAGGAMALPVLLSLAGLAAFRPRRAAALARPGGAPLLLLLAIAGWAALSGAWSPVEAGEQALKLLLLAPLGLAFAAAAADGANRELVRALGVAAFIVLCGLMAIEGLADMPLNRAANPHIAESLEIARNVNRGAIVLLALTWGAAGALLTAARPRAGAALVVVSGLLSLPFGMAAQIAAWGAGVLVFALSLWRPRACLLAISAGLAVWLLGAPFLTPLALANPALTEALPYSWAARAGIWNYVCAKILERPWLGHGLDASRAVNDTIVVQGVEQRAVQLHPHSASLQIWFETGAVGAVIAAAALITGGLWLAKTLAADRPAAAAAAASLASLGVIANVGFGIWQEWWIATMFVAAALVAALPRRSA